MLVESSAHPLPVRNAMNRLRDFVSFFGVLRTLLVLVVVALVIAAPFYDGPIHATGWPLVRGVIAPALFAIMVFVLPLELTMTLVFMSGGQDRRRLRIIVLTEVALFVAMLAAWTPFVAGLLRTLD